MKVRRGNHEGTIGWDAKRHRFRGAIQIARKRLFFYGATRKRVAEQFESARQRHAMGLAVEAASEPLSAFVNRWLEDSVKTRCRPRTYALYKQQVDAHIIPTIGDLPIGKITPALIQTRLIGVKLAEGLSPNTVRHIRAVLRSAFTQLEKWLIVPRNVVKLTDPPRHKRRDTRIFTPEQAKAFIGVCQGHRLGPLFGTMLATGLRLGEALALNWENVNLDAATIFVRESLQRVVRADKTSELRLAEPKSDRSYRLVSVPRSIVAILVKQRARQNRERLVAGRDWVHSGAVFTSTIGTFLDERNVRAEFYALLKSANLPRIRLHDLRHSCATILLAAGEHPKVVQELLGHSSVQLTLDTYSHLLPDMKLKERAAARLEAILGSDENCGPNCGPTEANIPAVSKNTQNHSGNVVSREGIEPSTRRLRVCCSAN